MRRLTFFVILAAVAAAVAWAALTCDQNRSLVPDWQGFFKNSGIQAMTEPEPVAPPVEAADSLPRESGVPMPGQTIPETAESINDLTNEQGV